ncbi:ATP-binding cassette subfamily B protein [Kutzneria viridogrisea]|uniref:ATP-binding cassette subfamily B protein n=1 Tax=Kutzneria viridogrisea TaxID=47990 RepID=A0ABR6BVT0_9PSEU|nr:ATP-binding cassette subfamily B protein [Kutzneria viridogrisea]
MDAVGDHPVRHSTPTTLLRLWPYVKPVRWWLVGSAVAALLAMLAGLAIPLVIQRIIDGPVARGELASLPWLVAGMLLLGGVEAGLMYVRRRLNLVPSTRIEARMRMDLYRHLQRLQVGFHDGWQSGQLLSRAVNDMSTVRRWIAFAGIFLVVNSLILVTGVGLLTVLSPVLGLIVLCCGAPLILLSYLFETKYKVAARRAQDQDGDLASTIEESVLGIRVLKAFGRGRHMAKLFDEQARLLRGTELRKVRIMAALWAVLIALPELAIAGQLLAGALGIANGTMTVGTLVAALTVSTFLRWPFDSIGWLLAETNLAASACERYWEVRDTQVTVTDPEHPVPLAQPVRGLLRFEGVRFGYGQGRDLLRGVDLVVRPGETVALVGATGSGKTALTALVPRLADVTGGRITVDGVDVRDLALSDLRGVVATAFEEPVLFSASVRENVALGVPEASEEQVREALRVAQAEEFVQALPWGLDTRVGEQGLSLSGGQRQRLALARAVAGRPAVLVLDDPLSALDVHTEGEVERALREVLREVTALVVAHRPSTVQLADRVALLADGRITAIGTHSELLADNAEYRRLLSTMDDQEVSVP